MILTYLTTESYEHAVGGTTAAMGASMAAHTIYAFVSTTNCWISQGATPVATAGAGSAYVPANVVVYLDGSDGVDVATLQDSAGGKASLVRCRRF